MKHSAFLLLALLAGATTFSLQGFAPLPGGDSYTIYVNDKKVLEHFVHAKGQQPTGLNLEGYQGSDPLVVHYSHCGTVGRVPGRLLSMWQIPARASAASTFQKCSSPGLLQRSGAGDWD